MDLDVSGYDRSAVTPGIVHIGVGGFHRAHQAVFIDDVLALGDLTWGIVGVGLLPGDAETVRRARAQDCRYSLTTVDPDGQEHTRVIGSILDHLHAPEDTGQILDLLASPGVRIVSLTITEGGYELTDALRTAGEQPPRSVWGFLLEGLRRRREAGLPPLHGAVLRQHPGQRRGGAAGAHRLRPGPRPRDGRLGGRARRLPQLDGGPDHPGGAPGARR
nr:hypothetical protein [Arachnia propionica]